MKKKTVTIVMIVVAILIVIAACIGLKSCSSFKDGGNGSTEVEKDGVVITDEEEKDEVDDDDEANEKDETDQGEEIVADDVADWGDATEGVVEEDKTTTSTDKNSADKTTTDKNNEDKDTVDKDTADSDNGESNTKKQYTITYDVNNANATIDSTTQEVTFGEAFTLATPKLKGGDDYRFVKWVITGTKTEFKSGVYTTEGDISLTAIWEELYSKNY